MVGLGVQQAYAQTGANDAGVIIDKGAALVGVELGRKPPTADRFFESLVKGLSVGLQKIAGVRNQARVIIDDDTQLGGEGFSLARRVEKRAGGKVHHPEIVDEGRLETLGRPAQRLLEKLAAGLGR